MNIEDVGKETLKDIVSTVCKYVQDVWPQHKVDNNIKSHFKCRNE